MSSPKREQRARSEKNLRISEKEKLSPDLAENERLANLEEYKLANQLHQGYFDFAAKTVTIYLTITALSIGFVFRDSISEYIKILFCWFNLLISLLFFLSYGRFYKMATRLSKRMDELAGKLHFELPHHHALGYGLLLSLLGEGAVLIFWAASLLLHFWR